MTEQGTEPRVRWARSWLGAIVAVLAMFWIFNALVVPIVPWLWSMGVWYRLALWLTAAWLLALTWSVAFLVKREEERERDASK